MQEDSQLCDELQPPVCSDLVPFIAYACSLTTPCSTAAGVKYKDTLPETAKLVDGSLEVDLGKVSVGSHVKHSYVIVFTQGSTQLGLSPAIVTYQPEAENADVVVSRGVNTCSATLATSVLALLPC